MELVNMVSGTCWKCTEKDHGPDYKIKGVREVRIFEVARGMLTKNTPTGKSIVDVRDVLKCRTCGEIVPLDTWRTYQANGDIVIKKTKERRGV